MAIPSIPFKTPDGLAELGSRKRSVSQRHRTVLLLVDGKRSVEQVKSLSQQAGVPDECYEQLIALGLIALPVAPVAATPAAPVVAAPAPAAAVVVPTVTAPVAEPTVAPAAVVPAPASVAALPLLEEPTTQFAAAEAVAARVPEPRIDPPVPQPVPAAPTATVATAAPVLSAAAAPVPVHAVPQAPTDASELAEGDTWLPASRSMFPDSVLTDSMLAELPSVDSAWHLDTAGRLHTDPSMEEARELMIDAVRSHAPLAGSLTLLKIRRARSRYELERLLDDVEMRIAKANAEPGDQTVRRVRDLLGHSRPA